MNKISLETSAKLHSICSIEDQVRPSIENKRSFLINNLISVTNSNDPRLIKFCGNIKNGDCKLLNESLLRDTHNQASLLPSQRHDDGIFKIRNHFFIGGNIYSWVAPISYLREINPYCYLIIKNTLINSRKICNMAMFNMKKISYLELAEFYKRKIGLMVDKSDAQLLAEGVVKLNSAVDFFCSNMDNEFIFPRDMHPDEILASYSSLTKKIIIYNSIFKADSATITHIFLHEISHSLGAKDYFYHRTPKLSITRDNERLHDLSTFDALNKKTIDLSISANGNFLNFNEYTFGPSFYKDNEIIKMNLNPKNVYSKFFKMILTDKSKLKKMAFSNADTNAVFILQLAGFGINDMKKINQLSKLIKNVDTNSQVLNITDIQSFFDEKDRGKGGT
ncbi:hypothetical protein [Pectobacterium brasiliense]|uniref:hypothetical protein n=1 Tax=Pectobacterium brasiliense TaxID=180957 RepID=UPI0019696232|nr:hypothetical protein [Pectobacterium brasiliense]MBN3263369.1 hypothetical protein [Pectobacterium brasiliense]